MPASEPTDSGGDREAAPGGDEPLPEEELQELEETVDRLLERMKSLVRRAREAEEAHAELRQALSGAGGDDDGSSEPVDERLRRLSRENERLRSALDRGRERAERIRQRLILLEDES